MKKISSHYEAWSMDMSNKLDYRANTLKEMRYVIDAKNKRAVTLGYKAEQKMIVLVSYSREMDGNRFVKAIKEEKCVEIYPEEV